MVGVKNWHYHIGIFLSAKRRKGFLNRFGGSCWKCSVSAWTNRVERIGFSSTISSCTCCTRSNGADDEKSVLEIGRKPMDKSCRVYGNFHVGNHNMIAGRRSYIAVQNGA